MKLSAGEGLSNPSPSKSNSLFISLFTTEAWRSVERLGVRLTLISTRLAHRGAVQELLNFSLQLLVVSDQLI